jgi:hypothetical protein
MSSTISRQTISYTEVFFSRLGMGLDPQGISFGQIGNTQGCGRESDFVRPSEVRLSLRR